MAKKESKAINKKDKKEKKSKDKTSFFKGFKAELKKVSWPTPKQLVNNTTAVIVIVLILAAIVFVLDIVFESANKYGLDKIKEAIISTTTSEENNADAEDANNTETSNDGETTEGQSETDGQSESTTEGETN